MRFLVGNTLFGWLSEKQRSIDGSTQTQSGLHVHSEVGDDLVTHRDRFTVDGGLQTCRERQAHDAVQEAEARSAVHVDDRGMSQIADRQGRFVDQGVTSLRQGLGINRANPDYPQVLASRLPRSGAVDDAAESAAYRQGVADVVRLARASADRLESTTRRPLAIGFAVEALRAVADEGERAFSTTPTGAGRDAR